MTPSGIENVLSLATALAAGLLIGAERQQDGRIGRFAGARTFSLIALLGAIGMLAHVWVSLGLALIVGTLIAIAYYRDSVSRSDKGVTTEVAALVTYALGALSTAKELDMPYTDRLLLVAAGASVVLALLSLKKPLHGFLRNVSEEDVFSVMKLLLLAAILLPLLPNADMGPWGTLNPRHIGLLAVLISSISFAGYIAIRVMGPGRGLGLTGLLGGLASSTAVTVSFSGHAKQRRSLTTACAAAIVLASSTMFPRMMVDISVTSPALLPEVMWFLGAAGLSSLILGSVLFWQASIGRSPGERSTINEAATLDVSNPFSLSMAIKFAGLFTLVLLLSRAAAHLLPETGVYLSATFGAVANVDAITLSLGKLHEQGQVSTAAARHSVYLVAASNFASKTLLAGLLGGKELGIRIGISLAFSLAVAAFFLHW
ncbi:MAG: MgtC/SapB family protein [Myxococcales bacterium]|nr:MAG: MgtC/SapB family protein [Myxococcales bacterium]